MSKKEELFDWLLLNLESYIHDYGYTASGKRIEIEEPIEEYEIDWANLEKAFYEEYNRIH